MLPIPMDRTSGRRSSSIGCRSIVGRRTSVYVTSSSTSCDPFKLIVEINSQIALFRDLLIHIGQSKDCPELREKVRKLRRSCVEACKHTAQIVLTKYKANNPNITDDSGGTGGIGTVGVSSVGSSTSVGPTIIKASIVETTITATGGATTILTSGVTNTMATAAAAAANTTATTISNSTKNLAGSTNNANGIVSDNPHLLLLFYLAQLFLRELFKSYRLIQVVPMDMSGYYDNRAGPSNLGNVISQILLCKQITPDFNQEELCSITKDSQEIKRILSEIQEFIPQEDILMEKSSALTGDEQNGPWPAKRRRDFIYKNMGLLCCVSRPNYL